MRAGSTSTILAIDQPRSDHIAHPPHSRTQGKQVAAAQRRDTRRASRSQSSPRAKTSHGVGSKGWGSVPAHSGRVHARTLRGGWRAHELNTNRAHAAVESTSRTYRSDTKAMMRWLYSARICKISVCGARHTGFLSCSRGYYSSKFTDYFTKIGNAPLNPTRHPEPA